MSKQIPSQQDVYNTTKASVYSNTQGQLDIEREPGMRSFAEVFSKFIEHCYKVAQDSIAQTFSQTSTEDSFLKAIAFDRTNNQIKQKDKTFAKGKVVVVSSEAVSIPSGTQFITNDSEIYSSLVNKTTQTQTFLIMTLNRVNNYAIATVPDHNLGSAMPLLIAGANQAGFNGSQELEILSKDTFRWISEGDDETASGTITGSYLGVLLDVQSENATQDSNKGFTDAIEIASNVDFIEGSFITFNGIVGGKEAENIIEEFKPRLVEFFTTPQNKGNKTQHQVWMKQNTEAKFCYFFTYEDLINIYLTGVISKFDDNYNLIDFTTDELNEIKAKFIADNQLILGIESMNLSILNPSKININISITDLSPNTLDMKNSIAKILRQYLALLPIQKYLASGKPEISADKIKSIIYLARDSLGNTPNLTGVSVSGGSSLDASIKKPVLGTISYS